MLYIVQILYVSYGKYEINIGEKAYVIIVSSS
jgi:hypothetical protein